MTTVNDRASNNPSVPGPGPIRDEDQGFLAFVLDPDRCPGAPHRGPQGPTRTWRSARSA